jgi:hypothetical protein
MIKSKVMEFTHGQTDVCTRATGGEANNMGLEIILCQEPRLSSASGKRERGSNGLMKISKLK